MGNRITRGLAGLFQFQDFSGVGVADFFNRNNSNCGYVGLQTTTSWIDCRKSLNIRLRSAHLVLGCHSIKLVWLGILECNAGTTRA